MLYNKYFDLTEVKSFANQSQRHWYECQIRKTRFQLRGSRCFFGCTGKKKHLSREIPRCCSTRAVLRRIHVLIEAETWIPDNDKNLVLRRTIGRQYFQKEDRFFDVFCRLLPTMYFDFDPIPPPRFVLSFSASFSFVSFSFYFTIPIQSYVQFTRKIFFFVPQRNPSSSFILT